MKRWKALITLRIILQAAVEAHLLTPMRGVICNCYFVSRIWYLVLLWCVPCILCARHDLEEKVWLYNPFNTSVAWRWTTCFIETITSTHCTAVRLYLCEGHFWNFMGPPIFMQYFFAKETFHNFEMRYWRTVRISMSRTSIVCTKCDHFVKKLKTSGVRTTDRMVETPFSKLRGTSDTFVGRAYSIFHLSDMN